jgi:hypothetical protein
MGDMVVDVPNGIGVSKIHLPNLATHLSPSDVWMMLYDDVLKRMCTMHVPDGEKIGEVPKSSRGLYRVVREPKSAYITDEKLTSMEPHRHMGYCTRHRPQTRGKGLSNGGYGWTCCPAS